MIVITLLTIRTASLFLCLTALAALALGTLAMRWPRVKPYVSKETLTISQNDLQLTLTSKTAQIDWRSIVDIVVAKGRIEFHMAPYVLHVVALSSFESPEEADDFLSTARAYHAAALATPLTQIFEDLSVTFSLTLEEIAAETELRISAVEQSIGRPLARHFKTSERDLLTFGNSSGWSHLWLGAVFSTVIMSLWIFAMPLGRFLVFADDHRALVCVCIMLWFSIVAVLFDNSDLDGIGWRGKSTVALCTEGIDAHLPAGRLIVDWARIASADSKDDFVRVLMPDDIPFLSIPLRVFANRVQCERFVDVVNAQSKAARGAGNISKS